MTGVRSGPVRNLPREEVHVLDDLRVPEVIEDVASGIDLATVAMQTRDPAGVVPLLGYGVQFVGSDVPALFVRRGVGESGRRQEPGPAPAASHAGAATSTAFR